MENKDTLSRTSSMMRLAYKRTFERFEDQKYVGSCEQHHSFKKIQTRRVNENFLLEVITGQFGTLFSTLLNFTMVFAHFQVYFMKERQSDGFIFLLDFISTNFESLPWSVSS